MAQTAINVDGGQPQPDGSGHNAFQAVSKVLSHVRRDINTIENKIEVHDGGWDSLQEWLAAGASVPVFFGHTRTLSNFVLPNMDSGLKTPPPPPAPIWNAGFSRSTLYRSLLLSNSLRTILLQDFGFGILMGSVGTMCNLCFRFEAYTQPGFFVDTSLLATHGKFSHFFLKTASAMSEATNQFKFFPSFLILGYLGYAIGRWRNFFICALTIQSHLHDIALGVGSAIVDPSDPRAHRAAFNVYRYLNLSHLLC